MNPPFYCAQFEGDKMKLSEMFTKEIGYINNAVLQQITINTLDSSPKCIKTIPASSTGKYHPTYSLGEGGLVRHIKAAVGIAHGLIETDIFKNIALGNHNTISENELQCFKDCAYVALILHDCCKALDSDNKHHTQFEHPVFAAKQFRNNVKLYLSENKISNLDLEILKKYVPYIYKAIASHMGQWNTKKNSKTVLPEPENGLENFVHLCDYLASRKYLIFDFSIYNEVKR